MRDGVFLIPVEMPKQILEALIEEQGLSDAEAEDLCRLGEAIVTALKDRVRRAP